MNKSGYVYIMTNKNRTTLYIGVTNDLCRRIYEHKNHLLKDSFTDKYNLEFCIYYEEFPYFDLAIQREKKLKKWNRKKKENLIGKMNPEWRELVTERGFNRDKVSFTQQVESFLRDMESIIPGLSKSSNETNYSSGMKESGKEEEIPPDGRNDNLI